MSLRQSQRHRGFTLLEIMVALVILAVGMSALVKAAGGNAANASYLKSKTFAQWVAENLATEYRLKGEFPAVGRKQGVVTMVDRQWRWQIKVTNTDDNRIRRLDIGVSLDGADTDTPISTLIAFVGKPL